MSRRLKRLTRCAVCAQSFRPFHQTQRTCSHTCRAIREAKIRPQNFSMQAANKANRERFLAQLEGELRGLTPLQAYMKGRLRGYRTGYTKGTRDLRRSA